MISVVIPSYNSGNYLIEAVKSALKQSVEKEIVVIDDCSSDSSMDVLYRYLVDDMAAIEHHTQAVDEDNIIYEYKLSLNDTLIRLYKSKINRGVAATRNIGVNLAEGEYIALLDSDDWWDEDKLERQMKAIIKKDAVLCCTAREIMKPHGGSADIVIHCPKTICLKDLEKTNYINCSSVLVKKDVLMKYPMEDGNIHEDYLTWLRLLKDYKNVIGIDEPLLKYRLSVGGKSRNKLKSAIMTYRTYCKAGYGVIKSGIMMFSYTYNGIKKYM